MFKDKRIAGIDNLRVLIALFVAIFHIAFFIYLFHAAELGFIAYSVEQVFFTKMPKTPDAITFFMLTYVAIFMNSFFLLAGFFANWVCIEKGVMHFVRNRLVRIGIPFIFYFICVIIYYLFSYLLPQMVTNKETFLTILSQQYYHGSLWSYLNNTSTYWFLDFLLFYSAASIVFVMVKKTKLVPKRFYAFSDKWIQILFLSRWIYLSAPLFLLTLLFIGHHWYFVLDDRIIPGWHVLLFYSIWYVLGWNVFQHQSMLNSIQTNAGKTVILSFLFYFAHAFIYMRFVNTDYFLPYFVSCVLFALSVTCSVTGFIGLFLRYGSIHRPWLKYLSEGSYWMYLIQIPIIYIVAAVCVVHIKSFFLQFLICVLVFSVIYFLTYHFLVRQTRLRKVVG